MRKISSGRPLSGTLAVPGDRSVSHRSVILSSLAENPVVINNFLFAEDCLSTVRCMRALGADIRIFENGQVEIQGNGLFGLNEPRDVLDAGNSPTTIRLLSGVLGAQPFFSVISGDPPLLRRPMGRLIAPLLRMGCRITGRDQSRHAPLAILPAAGLTGIRCELPVAGAQVKSAVLLAALFAAGETEVLEPSPSRDHTERMLTAFGVDLRTGVGIIVQPVQILRAPEVIHVPGDISSAACWLTAGSIIQGSRLTLRNVGVNPSRTGILDVLGEMGADITAANHRLNGAEPVADLTVRFAALNGVTVEPDMTPRLIDEIPLLAVAALFAEGRTTVKGAEEMRTRETDRLSALVAELGHLGARVRESPDGFTIDGPQRLDFGRCDSCGDHRIALALAIAAAAGGGADMAGAEAVSASYPDFFPTLERLQNLSS